MPHIIMPQIFYFVCRLLAFSAVCLVASAQPKIGYIEVYGVRKIGKEKVLKTLGVAPGGALPKSRVDLEEKLEAVDGILLSQVEAYCCDEGQMALYIGIQERGTPIFEYRPRPIEELNLPAEVTDAYAEFTTALARAAAAGNLAEDLTSGHSLMRDPDCRDIQEKFVALTGSYLAELQAVLARSSDTGQRTTAAYVLGYAADKKKVIDDLQGGLRDQEQDVRLTSARALRAIAVLGRDKSLGITIRATWFVEMLNSTSLGDRLEGARTLNLMFEELSEGTVLQIKDRALPSLFEMAHWRHLPHALPAYLLLGRVAAIPEADMTVAWDEGKRDEMLARIDAALLPKGKDKKSK